MSSICDKQDFPILNRKINGQRLVYLDNAATSQKPRQVIETLTDYYNNHNSNVHRGVHTLSVEATDMYEGVRGKVQKFINARHLESIIWTRSTTEALNLVMYSYGMDAVGEGDNIVTTAMEHHSNLVPWQQLALKRKAELRFVPVNDQGTLDMEKMRELIDERTKLVTLAQISNVLGIINPIAEVCALAHKVGAVVVVDAAQSVPHIPVDVQALDCDFLAFSSHKMLGPTGVGALYARRQILERMTPLMFGGDMILEVTYEGAQWNELPHRFEAGTPNIADVIGLGAAIDYLDAIGMDKVYEHEARITEYALDQFGKLENYKIMGSERPANDRIGVIAFTHNTIHAHDLGTGLDRLGIAIRTGHHCAMPLIYSYGLIASARASFYIYNDEDDVDALIDGLKQVEDYFSN